ncbi:MAG: M28 family peptidase, partial [Phycisphaerae bacterium]
RGVGTPGIDLAAGYIAGQFQEAGLQPAGPDGTWFQPFEMSIGQELKNPSLVVAGEGDKPWPAAVLEKDFIPLTGSSGEKFKGPLAFAGYGITHKDEHYDDYADFDARGKVLLMLRYEPRAADENAKFGGRNPSSHATFRSKAALARKNGAVAVLIVNPPLHHGEKDELTPFRSTERAGRLGLPVLHVSREFAARLLAAGGLDDLETLQKALDEQRRPRSADLKGLTVTGEPGVVPKTVTARNVVGLLPGRGPKADEYVVVGAHYDHLGRTPPRRPTGSAPAGEAQIHNGADDNASGTAGLIELARAFGARGAPRRSLLFIAFSGEELGLFGSAHYVDHPLVPIEKTVAMLNLDMIGRMRGDKVDVLGIDTAREFDALIRPRGERLGLKVNAGTGGFGPSDHASFYKKKVPAVHFFTGLHNEYHMPEDDAATINAPGAARVVRFVYQVADALAGARGRPTYTPAKPREAPRTGLKVRLGVLPSYAQDDRPGMLIEGTSPGSPAAKAGLREGDRLLRIGDQEVNDVYGLMDALARYNPGDTARLSIVRGDKKLELHVTFEAPASAPSP